MSFTVAFRITQHIPLRCGLRQRPAPGNETNIPVRIGLSPYTKCSMKHQIWMNEVSRWLTREWKSHLLAPLPWNLTLIFSITLVANNHPLHVLNRCHDRNKCLWQGFRSPFVEPVTQSTHLWCVFLNISNPVFYVVKRLLVRNIID